MPATTRFTPSPISPVRAGQRVTYSPAYIASRTPLPSRFAQWERGTVLFIYHGIATVDWENGTRSDLRETDLVPAPDDAV